MQSERVQLSDRALALRPSSTLAVTAMVNAMKARGIEKTPNPLNRAWGPAVIGFGAGQPDFDTPPQIKQAAIRALEAGQTKYMPTPGTTEAREAIARKLREENAIECTAADIIITAGAKHAMYMTLQVLINPGDEVILPTPAWVSYAPMIELAGGRVVELPGAIENDFKITPEQLADALAESAGRTAAIILNSASNPCGTMYSEAELRALAAVLEDHPRVQVIMDEIYEKIVFHSPLHPGAGEGQGVKGNARSRTSSESPSSNPLPEGEGVHFSMGSLPTIADRVITINGLSKAFAMTGWRIGYLCAPGCDGAVAKAIAKLQDQMTSNITSFTYAAIVEALTNAEVAQAVERMRQQFARRGGIMYDLVARMPGLRCPAPTGAFYLFPDVSAYLSPSPSGRGARGEGARTSPGGKTLTTAQSFAEALLEEARVAVVPGEDFGRCAQRHVRLSFACSDNEIKEGCRRMDEWLRTCR